MNKLVDSPSLYLRQHASNPVDWYPWGKEAIARAKKEDKPIFLSIGYSTCYWCHVMEREVFENPEIAKIMNRDFINIKVDREERPDIDDIYMSARQVMTQEGGWPNNLFLTTNLKPFFGGGTFAPENKYGRPGFPETLDMITQSWEMKREEIEEASENITLRIQSILAHPGNNKGRIAEDTIENLAEKLSIVSDRVSGGFHQAPKFPHESYLLFLLDYHKATGKQQPLDEALRSLDMMAAGGIFDHVGGGFHRYATDTQWKVPHFEKMLYNQALLVQAYVSAFEITGNSYYEYIARSTLDFVATQMSGKEGYFYSAFDAETDGVEGSYYVWNKAELKKTLSVGANKFLNEVYDFADLPHFSGHQQPDGQVMFARAPLSRVAADRGQTYDDLQAQIDKVLGKMLSVRNKRKAPTLDKKAIVAWNGMMITAFARAGAVFDDKAYVSKAAKTANFILKNMLDQNNTLARIWVDGKTSSDGFLEDYTYFVQGLLALARATGKDRWIESAIGLINRADDFYYDGPLDKGGKGGFFFTRDAKDLIVKIKTADDSAIPSANSIMVHALADMNSLTKGTKWEHDVWKNRANETINYFADSMNRLPEHYVSMLHGFFRLNAFDKLPVSGNIPSSRSERAINKLSSANYVKIETQINKKMVKSGKDIVLNVTLKIERNWHINTNPASLKFLVPTVVDIRGDLIDDVNVKYPSKNSSMVMGAGEKVDVYEDEVVIPVKFTIKKWAKPGDFVNANILVTFQACNQSTCLQPAEQVVSLPLIVSGK